MNPEEGVAVLNSYNLDAKLVYNEAGNQEIEGGKPPKKDGYYPDHFRIHDGMRGGWDTHTTINNEWKTFSELKEAVYYVVDQFFTPRKH